MTESANRGVYLKHAGKYTPQMKIALIYNFKIVQFLLTISGIPLKLISKIGFTDWGVKIKKFLPLIFSKPYIPTYFDMLITQMIVKIGRNLIFMVKTMKNSLNHVFFLFISVSHHGRARPWRLLTLSGTVGRLCTTFFVLVFFIFPTDFGTLSMQIYTY